MLQDRYETDNLFSDILKLTNAMDPVLVEIDQLLDDEELYQSIRQDSKGEKKKNSKKLRKSFYAFMSWRYNSLSRGWTN